MYVCTCVVLECTKRASLVHVIQALPSRRFEACLCKNNKRREHIHVSLMQPTRRYFSLKTPFVLAQPAQAMRGGLCPNELFSAANLIQHEELKILFGFSGKGLGRSFSYIFLVGQKSGQLGAIKRPWLFSLTVTIITAPGTHFLSLATRWPKPPARMCFPNNKHQQRLLFFLQPWCIFTHTQCIAQRTLAITTEGRPALSVPVHSSPSVPR